MNVSVFGLGYVGSVSAASFAADGHTVVGVDVNADKVASLNEGRSPIVEKGLDELIRDNAANGRLRATTTHRGGGRRHRPVADLRRHAEPPERQPGPHATWSASASRSARRSQDKDAYHVVVVRSTVLPGTTHDVVIPALERTSGKKYGDRLRRHGESRVPARGHGDQGLPQAAADAGRPQLQVRRRSRPRRSTRRSRRRSSPPASAPPR